MRKRSVLMRVFYTFFVLIGTFFLVFQIDVGAQEAQPDQTQLKMPEYMKNKRERIAKKLPNLTVSVKSSAKIVDPKGLKKYLKATVKNDGRKAARNFYVEAVLFKKANISAGRMSRLSRLPEYVVLEGGRVKIPFLEKGKTAPVHFPGDLPIPDNTSPGDIHVGILVDRNNNVLEMNENDNLDRLILRLMAVIERIAQKHYGESNPELDIHGFFFGANGQNKSLHIGPHVITDVPAWSPSCLTIDTISGPWLEGGTTYPVVIRAGNTDISNTFQFLFKHYFEYAEPVSGKRGEAITAWGFKFNATQGSKVLRLGGRTITSVVSWADNKIVFHVPSFIPYGNHDLYIMNGPLVVSNRLKIRVVGDDM